MITLSQIIHGQRAEQKVTAPEFTKEYDVIVCGLGTAGALAALFSVGQELSVLGIEAFTCVGGMHTAGGVVSPYFGCPGGRYEELELTGEGYIARRDYKVLSGMNGRYLLMDNQMFTYRGDTEAYEAFKKSLAETK